VVTSGATESNNLALRGVAHRYQKQGRHIISAVTEHKAVIDPLTRLGRQGFEITWLPVQPHDDPRAGWIAPELLRQAIRDDTILVSIMLANNEIGVIQPLAEMGEICRERGVLLHSDATQAVGKIPVDVSRLNVDLLSFSAHKFYGPKGAGALYVRRRNGAVRLDPQIDGGGQQGGLRSGTLNVPGIVGMARALELCQREMDVEIKRLAVLRNRLFQRLTAEIPQVTLNGPTLDDPSIRLAANLNCSFALVDGEALMINMRDLAVSSGSACTSANPEPSHVLRALGLDADMTRASLRFGLGRFTTFEEIEFAATSLREAVHRLRQMSSMA
jgi:cysteine desulfurase